MHMHLILVDPDLRALPVRIVFPHFLELNQHILGHVLDKDLTSESGHPHNVALRLVDRVRRFMQFHAAPSTGSRGTLLTPPPLRAGASRWIRSRIRRRCVVGQTPKVVGQTGQPSDR